MLQFSFYDQFDSMFKNSYISSFIYGENWIERNRTLLND